jgi:hypothetical protein
MFDALQLREVVELHEKSFALLRWVRSALRSGSVSFAVVHETTDSAEAANEWIRRHLGNIPLDARPADDKLPMFSRLFVSFLATSFRLNPKAVRVVSECGCRCFCCSYLQAGPNLETRAPSKKDFRTAVDLKRIYLGKLVAEAGIPDAKGAVEILLATPAIAEAISAATWGAELLRRSEFTSQGEAVLALWREFTWCDGRPKRNSQVTARQILDAEQKIGAAIRSSQSTIAQ